MTVSMTVFMSVVITVLFILVLYCLYAIRKLRKIANNHKRCLENQADSITITNWQTYGFRTDIPLKDAFLTTRMQFNKLTAKLGYSWKDEQSQLPLPAGWVKTSALKKEQEKEAAEHTIKLKGRINL